VGVNVDGTGLGVEVVVEVGRGEVGVAVGGKVWEGEQAESPMNRSVILAMM